MFKAQGDKKVLQQLVCWYNQGILISTHRLSFCICINHLSSVLFLFHPPDLNASLPEGVNPVDLAALIKCYIASLPEPLITFELYNDIIDARSSIHAMRNTLKKLPTVNYMTLELITALLLRVSQKSLVNKVGFIITFLISVHVYMGNLVHFCLQ